MLAALTMVGMPAAAQTVESAYFTEGFQYRHSLNPAFGSDRKGYVAMPFFGNINAGTSANIGVDNILFNRGGKTHTFLSPTVALDEFMSGINGNNRISEDFHMQLLGFGFRAFKGFNTVELNLRENLAVNMPGDLFELAKAGLQNQTYDLSGLGVNAKAYAELALGHSHQLNDKWRVGGKVKFLVGAGSLNAKVSDATVTLGENGYVAKVDAKLDGSIKGLQYLTKTEEVKEPVYNEAHTQVVGYQTKQRSYINDLDVDGTGINGFGVAIDLGAEYRINEDWAVSASLLDLGFISWSENHRAETSTYVNTDEYVFDTDGSSQTSFGDAFEVLGDEIMKVYQLEDKGENSRTAMLGATMHVGVEYTTPFYRKLKFGLLNTTRIQGDYSWTNFRLSANVAPLKALSISGNIAMGTYGFGLGAIIDIHCTGFNLFLASDRTFSSLSKQGIPMSGNGNVSIGINFPLGKAESK